MTVATDKKKISAYLPDDLERDAKRLAESRRVSLSTLVVLLLDDAVKAAKKAGDLGGEGDE